MRHESSQAAACAAPQSAMRRAAQARARIARRLRRLALRGLLGNPAAAKCRIYNADAAVVLRPLAMPVAHANDSAPGDRLHLAARTLSVLLCDEPNAARCRATVRARARAPCSDLTIISVDIAQV